MDINIESGEDSGSESNIREAYLNASTILRYLVADDDELDTLIMCNPANYWFVTLDQELYNALGSLQEYDQLNQRKLIKLLEVVKIRPSPKRHILTPDFVEKLRKDALSGGIENVKDNRN